MDGFTESVETYDGVARTVFRGGSGPAVIVMHEVPGLHPGVVAFARKVIAAGFTVYMPSLLGTPERAVTMPYNLASIARACVSREFATWASGKTSPIVGWLRRLAADAHAACGGPGVGAVGMCLTGGFALAMAVDDIMLAPVLSQPSLPFGVLPRARRDVGLSAADLATVCQRDVEVMGLRFTGDPMVPAARFRTLREALGDRFLAIEIDSSSGNAHDVPRTAHSVLTLHYDDTPGHPTRAAADAVIAFYARKLKATDLPARA